MSNTKVITTFGKTGKELYGNQFLQTFLQHWPNDIKLTVYYEDWKPDLLDDRIEYLDIDKIIPEVNDFRDYCNSCIDQLPKDERVQKRINWYNKAIRWSFKSFVMYKELERKDSRYIIWLDGDVSTLKKPDLLIAEKTLNGCAYASQLEFIKGADHCESGYVVFDTNHTDCDKIIDHIKNGYLNRKILELNKPWDGFWLALMIKQGISFNNLNKDKVGIGKTFTNRYLFDVLNHNVGNRKLKDNGLHHITGREENESW